MISPISLAGSLPIAPGASPVQSPTAPGSPFTALMENMLQSASSSREHSDAAIRDMITGRTENLHSVMLQAAQADLSFRLILEIRNRLSDAYQEVMKMQV